ncbi:acyl carrier protein [Priestia megaterium]
MNEFGFDSVSLTEYSNLLNEQYNLNIMPSIFFEHSTLYAFTKYLWEEYNQELKDYYLDEIVAFDKKTPMQVRDVPMVQKEEILSLEPHYQIISQPVMKEVNKFLIQSQLWE